MKFALRSKVSNKSNITWLEQENNTWFQSKIVLVPELLRYSHINYILLPLSQIAKSPNTNNTGRSNLTCHHADAEEETKSDDGRSQAVPQQADKNKMLLSTHLVLLGNWSLFVVQMGDKSFDLFEYILGPRLLTWINFNPSID